MSESTGTLDSSVRLDRPEGRAAFRRRRVLYGTTSAVLGLLVGLAVIDGLGVVDVYGVDTDRVHAEAGGVELDVRYSTVSRPGLATPFDITVRQPGGFGDHVVLAVDAAYLGLWDENGLDPDPSAATADERRVIWEFDPPRDGDVLAISYDARIEPAAQRGKTGRVAVLDADGREVVSVTFSTRLMP